MRFLSYFVRTMKKTRATNPLINVHGFPTMATRNAFYTFGVNSLEELKALVDRDMVEFADFDGFSFDRFYRIRGAGAAWIRAIAQYLGREAEFRATEKKSWFRKTDMVFTEREIDFQI